MHVFGLAQSGWRVKERVRGDRPSFVTGRCLLCWGQFEAICGQVEASVKTRTSRAQRERIGAAIEGGYDGIANC